MVIASARLTPRGQNGRTEVVFDPLYLDEIPDAMHKMGWATAEALMRRWFANPLYVVSQTEKDQLTNTDARQLPPAVFNKNDRRWQNKHQSGGDFVYSDVKWIIPPDSLRVLEI